MKNVLVILGVVVLVGGISLWRNGSQETEATHPPTQQVESPASADGVEGTAQVETQVNARPTGDETSQASAAQADDAKIIVYYLHRTRRCGGCLVVERYTRQALNENFADELASGRLEFRAVDIQNRDNRELVTSFGPGGNIGLILARVQGDHAPEHKNLVSIWGFLRDYNEFAQHLNEEINGMFEGA
jgi:hypothetical protein